MAITFLDEEPKGRKITFLDEETQEPVGTSIGQEISQLPAALKQSFGQPLEAMGETAQVAGFPAVATALKGAIQEPEGYVSAGQRFMEPQEGEFQIAGFAPQYAPRAIAEQTGQILGSIGSRIAGAVTLGGLGALIGGAGGAVAGAAGGAFAGPALFEAAQIVGPVALERAKNNGYTEPTDEDMAYAIVTAAGSGLLNAFGAKYLPGGEKAVGSFSKRLAASFFGEGIPEGLDALIQQVGETVETKKGIQVSPKQAIGEALIGGGAGAAATIASVPFTPEQIEEQKITERANKEAENLVIGNDNPQGKAVLANKQKLEQEIADTKQVLSAIESTDPVAQKLKLELKEKEAILAAAQGQVDSIVDSNEPIVEAEKQQIELAKAITEPAPEVVAPVSEVAPEVPVPVTEAITPPAEVAPTAPVAEVAPAPTEVTPTIAETLPVTPKAPAEVRKMAVEKQKITPRTPEETDAFNKASSNKVMARNPELAVAAVRLNNGEITAGEYADLVDKLDPFTIKGAESIPTKSKIDQYIDEGKKDKVNAPIESGKEVEFRIDIPTYNRSTAAGDTVYAVTAHEPVPETSKRVGTPISYVGIAKVINPKMMTRSISGKGEAIDIATGSGKFPLATVKGNYEAITELPSDINDPNAWTEVSYNPIRSSYFVDVRSKNAVVGGSEAIMVGSRVFVKNPQMEARPKGLLGEDKRYMARGLENQEIVTPIPEANRYTFEEAVKAVDAHFGKKGIPEGVVIVNNTTESDLEMKAGYFVNRGQIVINLAYIAKGENLGDIIDHELGHYIFGDPKFQADFKKFWELMTPEEKAKADQIINQFYNKETGAVQMEEKQVRAFMQLIQDSKAMPKWKQLLDKIKRWINEKLGTNLQVTDRGALAVLAAAHKRFKSGEQIVREIDSGVLKTAETAQDAEYLAAVERGDMETAQRMVDEAAKKAGYIIAAGHATPFNFNVFDRAKISDTDPDTIIRGFFFSTEPRPSASYVSGLIDRGERGDVKIINAYLKPGTLIKRSDANRIVRQQLKNDPEYQEQGYSTNLDLYFPKNANTVEFVSGWKLTEEKKRKFEQAGEIKEGNAVLVKTEDGGVDMYREADDYGPREFITGYLDLDDAYNQHSESQYIVKDSNQIKSADPVTYDDAGNVIPLSQRFQPSEPDIRRMAVEPTGEKPTAKRKSIMGEELGELKDTPKNIIAKTKELLRERVLNPSEVTEKNTTEAFRALGKLLGNKQERRDFADELNNIATIVDDTGAAAEVSMGAALFVNDLFEYAVRLAAQGDKKMLGIMMSKINDLPTGTEGRSDAGRALRAAREMKDTFLTMAKAEQDAFINYAAEFVYGPNPTKQQVDSIKIGYDAVEKVQEPTAKEVEEEIAAVGEKTGTDLVGRINDEFTKATEKGKAKRKTEEAELDAEYKKIQEQADKEIEKLAKIQSDTPSFDPTAARQTANDVRAIVANDLKQRPDMGRKAPWKSMLVAKLQEAGVEVAAAETLADIVWRQHEINNLSRELSSINKAVEKGPISEIIKAIKETPLEQQQNPNWRYEVMRDYLRKAGLSVAQAERIAKLMDISLQKRFTQAKEQAFTDAISKTAPWKSGDVRSKRAFQQVLQAIRAGALDPSRNMVSDIAALNGWTGFTADQYKNLLKFDAILADEKTGELEKANAYKGVQDIISKSKLPISARDVIGQYYDAQALSGIPTLSVNSFSPIAFAMRNAIVEAGSGTIKGDAKAIGRAATVFVDSIKSWANTVAFSFKNNVTVYSNVDYIVNDDNLLRLYRKGVDQFTKSKNAKERADGVKNMMIGMMDYVRRILNALDYGAIASLQNQNISKYAMAVMKNKGLNNKQANEVFTAMMKAKNDFYLQQIAIGTDKNKASILADEFYISSWKESLEKEGVTEEKIKSAMDAAINDALSSVGRNRQSLDAFKEEATNLKDAGMASSPALWLLESVANAANRSDSQFIKIFSRVIYGFAIVPARVIRETAWFSPYGFVRIMVDAALKNRNIESRYAQSLGSDFQRQQRLNEAIAGTVALFGLMALRASSTDDPEDEDEFKIVFTGNGPQRKDDPQFYDSWYKAGNKPNSMIVSFGKTKFTLNMMRGFEAFTWPAMMLGAIDDLEIRKKQKQQTKTPAQLEDAAIVAGFVFDAALRRGPYAFTTKSLFGTYGDIGVEGVAKGLTFPAKTLIPVLGTSLASNLSNFLNDPIDRRTLDGAVWSNIPFIGPAVAPKSLNAFGEPSLSTDLASKMFKLGVPIVYDIPTDRESIKLHELVLKQGGGPSIPTRNQLAQRLDRQPTNKEYEMFVREYGTILTKSMKKNYDKLFNAKPEFYSRAVERIGLRARDVAENKVRQAAKKP